MQPHILAFEVVSLDSSQWLFLVFALVAIAIRLCTMNSSVVEQLREMTDRLRAMTTALGKQNENLLRALSNVKTSPHDESKPQKASAPDAPADKQISAEQLKNAEKRRGLLAEIQKGERLDLSGEDWAYLCEQRAVEFIPYVLDRESKYSDTSTFDADYQLFKQRAKTFLSSLPDESVREALNRAVGQPQLSNFALSLISDLLLADVSVAADLLAKEDDEVAKRGLALFACHSRSYNAFDLEVLRWAVENIPNRFPSRVKFLKEKGLLGESIKWLCPCGKKNSESVVYCGKCEMDACGFLKTEQKPDTVLAILKSRIAVLEKQFTGNSLQPRAEVNQPTVKGLTVKKPTSWL